MNAAIAAPGLLCGALGWAGLAAAAWHRFKPRPTREWWLDWADQDGRQRVCIGARMVHGPVLYYHFGLDDTGRLVLVYVGKALVFARRMRQEAHERMSDDFVMTLARSWPASSLNATERAEIERYAPTRHNRQHNGKRVAA